MNKVILTLLMSIFLCVAAFGQTPATASSAESTKTSTTKRTSFRPTKEQISEAQTFLKAQNLYKGEVTGKYDVEFRAAIKEYQISNGLDDTGRLNRATLEKMGIELTDSQKEVPVTPDSYATADNKDATKPKRKVFRATKTQITEAQEKLKTAGLYSGEMTGKLDDATREAVKKYQEANDLAATSGLTRETVEKMGIALTDTQNGVAGTSNDKTENAVKKRSIFRATTDQIKAAQQILIGKGDLTGEPTGKLDDPTRVGLKKYQEANGLKVTGTLNQLTLEKMGIELTDKQKENAAAKESSN